MIGVTWMCQKEAENSSDIGFQSQDFHRQGKSEAIGILWKAQVRIFTLGTPRVLEGQQKAQKETRIKKWQLQRISKDKNKGYKCDDTELEN